MVQRIVVLVLALPPFMLIGLLILAAGGMLDLVYHTAPPAWTVALGQYLGIRGNGAHVVTLLGMLVTLLGLLDHRPGHAD